MPTPFSFIMTKRYLKLICQTTMTMPMTRRSCSECQTERKSMVRETPIRNTYVHALANLKQVHGRRTYPL